MKLFNYFIQAHSPSRPLKWKNLNLLNIFSVEIYLKVLNLKMLNKKSKWIIKCAVHVYIQFMVHWMHSFKIWSFHTFLIKRTHEYCSWHRRRIVNKYASRLRGFEKYMVSGIQCVFYDILIAQSFTFHHTIISFAKWCQ